MDIKKLVKKINEANPSEAEWDVKDIIKVVNTEGQPPPPPGPPGQSSDPQEDLNPNPQTPPPSDDGSDSDDDNDSNDGSEGEGTIGKKKDKSDSGKDDDVEVDTSSSDDNGEPKKDKDKNGDETSDKNNGKEWMDDHSKLEESDSSGKDLLKKVYKETKAQYGKARANQAGKDSGGFMTRVENFIKEDFDISKILRRLSSYKKKISETKARNDTYQAGIYNPVTQQGNIMAKGSPKVSLKNEGSAILFLAADTSGSITAEDYQSIFGYLNDIATKFKQKEHGIDGDVYLIEWDTQVHAPIRKWDAVSAIKPVKDMTPEERKEFSLRGMGGTEIQSLYDFMDKQFVKKNEDGTYSFVFSERNDAFSDKNGKFAKNLTDTKEVNVKLKPTKDNSVISKAIDNTAGKMIVKPGDINFLEGKTSNAPFLIVYTDGFFTTPNIAKSKLFGSSQGNILYVVTSRAGMKNIKPKNFMYHDVHGDEL